MAEKIVEKYFSKEDFKIIAGIIGENEKKTSGEIRLSISKKRPFLSKKKSIKELAEREFKSLKMHKTRDKTGILVYLLLNEKKFYILADKGINEKVQQSTWDNIRDKLQEFFKSGEYLKGISNTINEMGDLLQRHFPIKADDTNELSNEVVVK